MGTKPQQSKPAMPKKNRARIKKKEEDEEETDYIDGGKKLLLILILNCSQDLYFSLPLTKSCSCMCKCACVCFFCVLVWGHQGCHNTLLVLCGQEEPGSAPITQLLTALVLSFGLTSSTCLPILRLHCDLSALWNVFSKTHSVNFAFHFN